MRSMQPQSNNLTPSPSIQSCLLYVNGALTRRHIEAGMQEASILLQHVTGLSHTDLYCNLQQSLSSSETSRLESLLQRRLHHEPLQYITGGSIFYGREFYVDERVLIPRPETELIVDIVVALSADIPGFNDHMRIADVGTGSGAIGLTIASELPHSNVLAVDASAEALSVATINRERQRVRRRVDLVQGDLLSAFDRRLDVVVANLPYIETETIQGLSPEVRSFEPRIALDGGADGLRQICRLLQQARAVLAPGGWLLLEVGVGQSLAVVKLMEAERCWTRISSRCDLQGIERVVIGRYSEA